MNYTRNARAALAGISPHQPDKHIRRLQHAYVVELFSHEKNHSDRQVNDETWRYLDIKKRPKC